MTITRSNLTGAIDIATRDSATYLQKKAYANGDSGTAAQRKTAQNEFQDLPDFVAELQATTDTSDGEAIDLTDDGDVTFPARTFRKITLKSWCLTDNDTYYYKTEELVLGGTTPKLMGQYILEGWSEQNGTVFQTGRVHFAATITALTTITEIFASKGLALGDIASGVAALLVPQNRLILNKGCTLNASVVSVTAAGVNIGIDYTNLDGLGAGTGAVVFWEGFTSTDVLTDDPKVGTRIDLAFEIWPPFNHRLVMDSNNVTVKCTGHDNIGDDNLKHRVEVFIGPARPVPYSSV